MRARVAADAYAGWRWSRRRTVRNPQAWPTLAPSSRYCSPITTNPNNHRATVCHIRGRRPSFHRTTRIPNTNFARLPRNRSVPSTWLANDTASTQGTNAPRNSATPSEAGKTRCDNANPTISAIRASVVAARARRFSPASSGAAARGAGAWPRGRLRLGPGRVAFTRRIVAQLDDCPHPVRCPPPARWRCRRLVPVGGYFTVDNGRCPRARSRRTPPAGGLPRDDVLHLDRIGRVEEFLGGDGQFDVAGT